MGFHSKHLISYLRTRRINENNPKFPFQNNPLNPFPPSVHIWHLLAKLLILISEVIIKKFSYGSRDYVSVDENSLS